MFMIKCIKCQLEKDYEHFKSKSNKCNECIKEYQKNYRKNNKSKSKEYQSQYYIDNKMEILERAKRYFEYNKEKIREYKTGHYKMNKEEISKYQKEYYQNNKEILDKKNKEYLKINRDIINHKRNQKNKENRIELSEKEKIKRLNNPLYRLKCNIRVYIRGSIRYKGYKKTTKTENILGCSFSDFKLYLESKFEDWMTWDNYGMYNGEFNYGWDIDHIIPLSSAKTEEDIIKLNHHENLQPLCSKVNRYIKRDNYKFDCVATIISSGSTSSITTFPRSSS